MDERKILLVKLDATLETVTSLIGSLMIAQILNAAYSRADMPVNKRKQFNLYADEFHRFATDDFATILTEARKYGLATTIAHQARYQPGMTDGIRATTLGAANLVVFRVQPEDATELAGRFDITPQEAWEEEIEPERIKVLRPQRHERIEEQVEVEVEEDILEVMQDPVDYLVSTRGTHTSMKVREITQNLLVTLAKDAAEIKILINRVLVAVMDEIVQVKTDKFIDLIQETVIQAYDRGWGSYKLLFAKNRDYIRTLILSPINLQDAMQQVNYKLVREFIFSPVNLEDATQQAIENEIVKMILERDKDKLLKASDISHMTRKEKLQYIGYEIYSPVTHDALVVRSFVMQITVLAEELAQEPIRVPTGKKRMVKRIQPHITYLTHESEKITIPRKTIMHPQRTYADMLNEMASELANLPQFTAQAKIATEEKAVEHTVRTLEPERGIRGTALHERIANIKKQNIKSGYVRELATVEEEIRTRQEQCSQPPQEPPGAIYRRQSH
jgi:ribosomal protein L20A (L18A)